MPSQLVGTTTTSVLVGDTFIRGDTPGNVAFITNKIKNDAVNGFPIYPGAFSNTGMLYVPNRGVLQAKPGDVIATDPITGWPILISAAAIAAGGSSWVIV
jgi:hypothetical protein